MDRFKSVDGFITGYRFIRSKMKLKDCLSKTRKYCPHCGAEKTLKEIDFVRTNSEYDSMTGKKNKPEGWRIFLYSCDHCKIVNGRYARVNHYATLDGNKYYEVEEANSDNGGAL